MGSSLRIPLRLYLILLLQKISTQSKNDQIVFGELSCQ